MKTRPKVPLIAAVLGCSLGVCLLFAFAGVSGSLRLNYNLGYEILDVDFAILSKSTDQLMWIIGTAIAITSTLYLTLRASDRARTMNLLLLAGLLTSASLFASGLAQDAYGSMFVVVAALTATSIWFHSRAKNNSMLLCTFVCWTAVAFALVVVESLALSFRVMHILLKTGIPSFLIRSADIQNQLSALLFLFTPVLMLIAMFSWVPMLFETRRATSVVDQAGSIGNASGAISRASLVLLTIAFVIDVFVTQSPYFTQYALRGVDTQFYYAHLSTITNFMSAISQIGFEPRMPYLVLLYCLRSITGWTPYRTVIVGPSFLALFYTLAVFLFTRGLAVRGSWVPGLAAVFAASWVHTTVGLYAGIYANWLAMSFALLFLTVVVEIAKDGSRRRNTAAAIALSYLTALSHIWTWAIVMIATFAGSILLTGGKLRPTKNHKIGINDVGRILVASILPLFLLAVLLPGLGAGITLGFTDVVGTMRLDQLTHVTSTLTYTLSKFVGAMFAYPLIPILTILGAFVLPRYSSRYSYVLASILLVTSTVAVLLDSWFQWRVLYLIPFEVFAAIGMAFIFEGIRRIGKPSMIGFEMSIKAGEILLVALVILDSVNYALIAAAMLPTA